MANLEGDCCHPGTTGAPVHPRGDFYQTDFPPLSCPVLRGPALLRPHPSGAPAGLTGQLWDWAAQKGPQPIFFFNGPKWVGIGLAVAETAWRSRGAPVLTFDTRAPVWWRRQCSLVQLASRGLISALRCVRKYLEPRADALRGARRAAAPDICGGALVPRSIALWLTGRPR
jgi:hypothetical protein